MKSQRVTADGGAAINCNYCQINQCYVKNRPGGRHFCTCFVWAPTQRGLSEGAGDLNCVQIFQSFFSVDDLFLTSLYAHTFFLGGDVNKPLRRKFRFT